MAKSPVKPNPSVVLKLHKPSTAQVALRHQQDLAGMGAEYNAAVQSGRIPGAVGDTGGGLNAAATAGVHSATKTNGSGFVSSPLGDLGSLGKTSDPHRKVTVKIHPTGHIEVVHAPHAAKVPAAPVSGMPKPAPLPIGGKGGTPGAFGFDTDIKTPQTVANAKKRAAAGNGSAPAAPPLTDAQTVQNLLAQMYGPLVNQATSAIKDRQSGVNDYTKILAGLMDNGKASGAAYGQAETAQAAVDAALSAALGGNAATATSDLAGKLGNLGNADYAGKLTGDLGTAYKGAEGTRAATGSNTLGSLIAEGAHAKEYSSKQPGIAGLFGLQATKGLSKELKNTLSSLQTTEATQIPALLQNLTTNRNQQAQLALENRLAAKEYGLKATASKQAQGRLDNQTATTLSNLYGVDANGNMTLAGRKVADAEAKAKKKQVGLSPSSKATLLKNADKRADDFYYGTPPKYYQGQPVAGSGRPPVEYPQALQRLVAMGLTVQQATKTLNARYQPGEGGRPMFTKKQEAINNSILPDPFASLTQGH